MQKTWISTVPWKIGIPVGTNSLRQLPWTYDPMTQFPKTTPLDIWPNSLRQLPWTYDLIPWENSLGHMTQWPRTTLTVPVVLSNIKATYIVYLPRMQTLPWRWLSIWSPTGMKTVCQTVHIAVLTMSFSIFNLVGFASLYDRKQPPCMITVCSNMREGCEGGYANRLSGSSCQMAVTSAIYQ